MPPFDLDDARPGAAFFRPHRLRAIVILTLSFIAAPANADDRRQNWAGLYLGGNAGYGWGNVSTSGNYLTTSGALVGIGPGTFAPPATFPGSDRRFPVGGEFGGGQVGYNFQSYNFVIGVEADWQAANLEAPDSFDATFAGPFYSSRTKIDWFGTVRGRLGYDIGGVLPYLTGGLAYGHIRSSLTIQPGTQAVPLLLPFDASSESVAVGYAIGAGIEFLLGASVSVKAEYLHIDLGDTNSLFDYGTAGVAAGGATTPFDIVRVGVNFHF